jgi:hypothetical protein
MADIEPAPEVESLSCRLLLSMGVSDIEAYANAITEVLSDQDLTVETIGVLACTLIDVLREYEPATWEEEMSERLGVLLDQLAG